jgi:20S proteasome alpha/beta subunit
MTVIVGVVGEGGVLLAADSQSSGDNSKRMRREPKTFQLTPAIALACCGSGRFGQVVTHWLDDYLEEPYPPLMADERDWAVRVFIPALVDCLEEHGHLHRYEENAVVELGDSAFLLAIRDRLFTVEPDMAVDEPEFAFDAMGSGEEAAMGAMHAAAEASTTFLPDEQLHEIAEAGVKAAVGLTLYVGGRMTTVRTSKFTAEERAFAEKEIIA